MKMKIKEIAIGLAFFAGVVELYASNLVYNSSFELEGAGWNSHTFSRVLDDKRAPFPENVSFPVGDAATGQRVLRIDCKPGLMETVVSSAVMPIKKNTWYTVSFSLKREGPGRANFFLDLFTCQRQLRYDAGGRLLPDTGFANAAREKTVTSQKFQVQPGGQWERHSFFYKNKDNTAFLVRIYLGAGSTTAVLLDDIQVEEGKKASPYSPREPMEFTIKTDDNLYEEPEEISGSILGISYFSDFRKETSLVLHDDFHGKDLAKQNIVFEFEKGVLKSIPFSFKGKPPYGSYQIYSSLQPRITTPEFVRDWTKQPETIGFNRVRLDDESYLSAARFVAVRTPRRKTETGFRIGTTGSYTPAGDGLRYASRYGQTPSLIRKIRLAGGNVHRSWDGAVAAWRVVEPEEGRFDWRLTDYQIESAEKTGTDVICVIGCLFQDGRGVDRFIPEWARRRDRSGNPRGTEVPMSFYFAQRFKGIRFFRPQLSDWRNYVSAVAKRYKGRIKYYEILNESNLYLPSATYMEYMKAASEEIRKADPAAVVLGLCSTSDFGVNIDDFIGQCLKQGADRYMDALTIHPYAQLDKSTPVSQMDARRKLIGNLKKYGYKSGLWNGENYFVIPNWMPASDYAGRTLPEDITRHLIVDMGEGCVGSTPTHFQSLTSYLWRPFLSGTSSLQAEGYPDARFAAHAAAAHFLAGAVPVATHELPSGALGYTFRREGVLYSAVWNFRAPVPTALNIAPMPHKVYDMMSNPVRENERLPLSAKPWFIEWDSSVKESEVIAWMNGKAVYCEAVFLCDRVLLAREGGTERLLFSAQNLAGEKLNGSEMQAESASFRTPVSQKSGNWGELKDFVFAIPVESCEPGGASVRISAKAFPKFSLTRPVYPVEMITLGRAPASFPIAKAFHGKPSSPEDFSATLTLQADMKGWLRATVDVRDDLPGKPGGDGWDTDSIELFFDRSLFTGGGEVYGPKTRQITFVRHKKKQIADGVSCTVSESAGGWRAEIRIPVRNDDWFGLDFAVNDSDGEHRKSQLVWSGSGENYKNRSGFKVVRISEAFAPRIDIREKTADGKLIRMNVNDAAGTEWTALNFTFIPDSGGTLPLTLMSGYSSGEQFKAEYRNLELVNAKLKNADFSLKFKDGKPKYWSFEGESALRMENGHPVFSASHDSPVTATIEVKAGVPVTVKYEARMLLNERKVVK